MKILLTPVFFLKKLFKKFEDQRGEIATIVALIGLGIVTVGIFVANQLAKTGPQVTSNATDCSACTSWTNRSCGGGTCANNLMYQTRTCSVTACYVSRCEPATTCGSSTWPANYCGTLGGLCSGQACTNGELTAATAYCQSTYTSTSKCCKTGTAASPTRTRTPTKTPTGAVKTPTRTRTPTKTPTGAVTCNQSCVSQGFASGRCSDAIGPGCVLNPRGSTIGCSIGPCQCCNAVSTPTRTPTQAPATNAKLPIGWHDGASGIQTTAAGCNAAGWACDLDRPAKALNVHFYSGSTFLGQTTANLTSEAAVNSACGNTANHRYAFALPASIYGSTHSISAYGINIDANGNANGTNPILLGSPKSITCNVSSPSPTPAQCRPPSFPPTLKLPANGSVLACTSNPKKQVTFTWDPISDATSYYLRIDDTADGWLGACPSANPLDFCVADITGTSYSTYLFSGHNFKWWVSAFNACGQGVISAQNSFSIAPVCTAIPSPTRTPTPGTTCFNACTAWQNASCGGGNCGNQEMQETRTCTISGCNMSRCSANSQCTSTATRTPTPGATCFNACSAWQDIACGGGSCGNLQMQQTRTCPASISGCNMNRCTSSTQCSGTISPTVSPTPGSSCTSACSAWTDLFCGGNCNFDQMEQTRSCTILGCNESQCISSLQCSSGATETPTPPVSGESAFVTFLPTSANVPPQANMQIRINSGVRKVAFAKILFSFDQSLVNLTSEITTNSQLATIVQKTSRAEANSTGQVSIIVAAAPGATPPSGDFEFARFSVNAISSSSYLNADLVFNFFDSQIVDALGPEIPGVYTNASLVINPAPIVTDTPTPGPGDLCPRGDLGNLDCSIDACIDTADFELFRQDYGKLSADVVVASGNHTPDLVQDISGMIDTADYEIIRSNFGSCQ